MLDIQNKYIRGAGLDLVRKYVDVLENMCGCSQKICVDVVRKYVDLVGKYVEGVRYKSKEPDINQVRSFWRTKRRGEPREEENQEKRRIRRTLQSSNLR